MPRLSPIAIFVAALVGVSGLFWIARREPGPSPDRQAPAPHAIEGRAAKIVLRHQGEKQVEVTAGRVEVSRDLYQARFQDAMSAIVYDRGEISARIRADELVLDRQTNDFVVKGRIELTSAAGDRLVASEARWLHNKQRLLFTSGVWLRVGESEIGAAQLTVDAGLRVFELSGDVDITFPLKGAGP